MPKSHLKLLIVLTLVALLALLLPGASSFPDGAHVADAQVTMTNNITLKVVSARTESKAFDGAGVTQGDPITAYKFLINEDNTGDPFNNVGCDPADPTYPDNCDLPSIRTVPGWSPVFTQGDETALSETETLTLPDGKYLISVKADGYKLDGEHFTLPMADPDGDGMAVIEVAMHPLPLPPATMVIKIFEDNALTNGQFDAPIEPGLAGFRASLNDIAGEITTDVFGNPLCTIYQHDAETGEVLLDGEGAPVIESLGQGCYSDAEGLITIPNIGPLRYDVLMFPPAGEPWIQTTTLEGSQGWDTWLQEAGTGLDNEFLIAAEPFPWTIFGFVRPDAPNLGGTGTIIGQIMAASTFVPAQGGLPYIGDTFGGFMGTKLHRPINSPWLSLNDLQAGDQAVWVGQGNADGSFTIPNVPEGNYFLTYWDEKQHYILDFVQVTVTEGQISDVGIRMLTGWFTEVSGTVFHDVNGNGRRDDGESAIPNYLVVLKDRDNTEIDRMSIAAVTDVNGFYELEKGYPMGSWMVLEAYSDLYHTTGVTYQTLNMPDEETILGGIVDIGLLPILGQPVRLDWGVQPYARYENGGIAGTVFYDTVRAEDDARYAGAEPWQPGIPDLTLNLYQAQTDLYGNPIKAADGSYAKGPLVATTVTETFERPKGCAALDVNGDPVDFPSLPDPAAGKDCLEGPLMGTQIGDGQNNLDGNWGFGEVMYNPDGSLIPEGERPALPAGRYLVEVVIPDDEFGNPLYQVTREEDLNVFDGDEFIPQIPPPACAGPLHTVDVAGALPDGYPEQTIEENGVVITVPASTPVENPGFADAYYPRYEGQVMPLCNVKYVELTNGKAVAPIFTLFTEVPIPGKWKGYIIDNLNVSVDPNTLFFGEMAGVPEVPIGLYDYSGRLVHTVHSDFNGVYEVLLPSTGTFNAPSPSGMFANVYYLYGNDPGPIGAPNTNYNPQYRSIGTSFEIYPGTIVPSDLAPTQNGAAVWAPGAQYNSLALCKLEDTQPQLFAVDKPYGAAGEEITVQGLGFGLSGTLSLGDMVATTTSWSDTEIVFNVPDMPGPQQLLITAENGLGTVNGLTFHVTGLGYNPTVYEVGVGKTYDPNDNIYQPPPPPIPDPPTDPYAWPRGPIQHAIDDAWAAGGDSLVVVYPGAPVAQINPLGMYIENPILYGPVKLQGVGPGGTNSTGYVPGAIIDGRAVGGDSPYNLWWRETFLQDIWDNRGGWDGAFVEPDGTVLVNEGAVITILVNDGEFTAEFKPAIDGFIIQGGDQQGFPNNINQVAGGQIPGVQPNVVVQGGGIFANGYASYLQITNDLIQTNGGSYGGAIRLGTPHLANVVEEDGVPPVTSTDNHNENVVIAHNRILANGGTNLAGAIALFGGADGYEIAHNDICGNSSIEYGGGISHYGLSPGGQIHDNRIYFNSSYDEGGGIMIAGELPNDPNARSSGAGSVDVFDNLLQSNLANDDGGGLRFLMAGGRTAIAWDEEGFPTDFEPFVFDVYNNMLVNNVSTHEGGGISLNDTPYANIFNNTIMKNLTTATAMTSDGTAAPAGLSSSRNSAHMQSILPLDAPLFSDPLLFNNLFWDNRAGTFAGVLFGGGVSGIGLPGDLAPIHNWDLGVADGSGMLSPTYSVLHVPYGNDASNIVGVDPLVADAYDTQVQIFPWRANANFVGASIVAVDLPITLQGDYHVIAGSPAIDMGTDDGAPAVDFDGDARPQACHVDIGADEVMMPPAQLYFSKEGTTPLPGVFLPFDDADIYAWDGSNYWCAFDASAAGAPPEASTRAVGVPGDGSFYLTLQPALMLPGAGMVTSEDIVRFADGGWSVAFDGDDVGLGETDGIDAFTFLANGNLVISIEGSGRLPGLSGNQVGEDLLQCTGTYGPNTSCTWSVYFDGSDIGLRPDVDGVDVASNGDIYLSTIDDYSVGPRTGGLAGGRDDVFTCHTPTTGTASSCTSYSLYFDGSANGIVDNLNALDRP